MTIYNHSMGFDGVLLVNKPQGLTSHDVVAHVRRKLQMKQIGHAGTLDPLATGLLILLVGRATKLSQLLMGQDKVYQAKLKLGEVTDSQDSEGALLSSCPVPAYPLEKLEDIAHSFLGDQYQIPPMFSAKKVKGVPLYKLARKGKEIEREPRFIRVSRFQLGQVCLPEIEFEVSCSKGTYIRTLAHDFGARLGCGAHLTALHRTQSGSFSIGEAIPLGDLESSSLVDIRERLIPLHLAAPSHIA